MGLFRKGKPEGNGGSKTGKDVFEPNEFELGLIEKFGVKESHIGFLDVKNQLAKSEVPEGRIDLVWEAIRQSRAEHQIPGSSPER
ncbi:MAG: hypothetical protein Q7S45_01235 [Candidatus Curtissbacteria bacterium]|nr:hypothetical protein [Candidatus Curtissbacteria bacterium]